MHTKCPISKKAYDTVKYFFVLDYRGMGILNTYGADILCYLQSCVH